MTAIARHAAAQHGNVTRCALLAAGFAVLRVTWSRFTQRPEREAARLRALPATR